MNTQLILVEGVPFTGKSTLSEFVSEQLRLNSTAAEWVGEGVMLQRYFTHVLAVLENKQTLDETLLWADWNTFAQTVATTPVTFVVDAALSFAAINPLLREDRARSMILATLKRIAELCAPLHPRVIHLTGDMERLAPASIVERGEGWQEHLVRQSDEAPYQQARHRSGVAGAIGFLQDAQALTGEVLEDGGWHALTVNVSSGDWATHRRAVLQFLGIDEVVVARPALTHEQLQSYTGAYQAEDVEGEGEILTVRQEQDGIGLYGPRMRFGLLIPLTPTRFHVRATRLDAEFVEDDGVQRLVVYTPDGMAHSFRRS